MQNVNYQRKNIYFINKIIIVQRMLLNNIINKPINRGPIVHQIDNEGCKCHLCQKIIIKEIRTIKHSVVQDHQSELTKGKKQEFFSKFLTEFYFFDKMARKVKIIFPEMCVFEKGAPICLITKKGQTLPMKIIKNKEKLNAFQIQNFFVQGYIFHNNFKENTSHGKRRDSKFKQIKKEIYNFDEGLKNQCIVLAKFNNGTCQMMTPIQLSNLFKSKERYTRNQVQNITTMVSSANYNQIRIHMNLAQLQHSDFFQRAKNEVKMINQDIKPKDFLYVPERQERTFQQKLKDEDTKKYLEYISLKLLLLYSVRTDVLFQESLFKFVKDDSDCFYLTDVQVYKKSQSSGIYGYFTQRKSASPTKRNQKKRPASSPERLQRKVIKDQDPLKQDFGVLIMPKDSPQKRQKCYSVYGRVKTSSFFKLQPIVKRKN